MGAKLYAFDLALNVLNEINRIAHCTVAAGGDMKTEINATRLCGRNVNKCTQSEKANVIV